MLTDPITDYLNRIRNALQAEHEEVEIPASRLKREMTRILKEQGYIAEVPEMPKLPKGALGTRATTRKEEPTELDAPEVLATLEQLPVWSSETHPDRFPVRAYFRVLWETGLRPVTIQRLRTPDHFKRGSRSLRITNAADKARRS